MDITKISSGKNPTAGEINVFVEIPQGSDVKYELDKESGVIMADRFLYTAMAFPFNYGFIPNTHADDGDPLDILLLCDKKLYPGVVMSAIVIGMLEMEDEAGIDTKVLAVPTIKIDPMYGIYKDVAELPEALKNKIRHFFGNYKTLEPGKWVKLKEWKGKSVALEAVKKALK